MFEDLYEKSVAYDDNLLQAACLLQAEFDLDLREYALISRSEAFKQALAETAEEYNVSAKDLRARLKEILD